MSRILLVDDDSNVRDALGAVLDSAGHDVTIAQDGAEALRVATETRPDIIVTDVMTTSMDGPEMIRRIRTVAALRHVPVVMMSALVIAPPVRVAAMLRKPFPPQELLRLLVELARNNPTAPEGDAHRFQASAADRARERDAMALSFLLTEERVPQNLRRCQKHIRRCNDLIREQEERLQRLRLLGLNTDQAQLLHDSLRYSVASLLQFERVQFRAYRVCSEPSPRLKRTE